MYIHTIKSGDDRQYVKRLLRIGTRDGRKVKNHTLLNLSKWDSDAITRLEAALHEGRQSDIEKQQRLVVLNSVLQIIDEESRRIRRPVAPSLVCRVMAALSPNRFLSGSRS